MCRAAYIGNGIMYIYVWKRKYVVGRDKEK